MDTLCVFLSVCVLLHIVCSQPGPSCQRANSESGRCIVFQSCEYYVNILNELGQTKATGILRQAACGFEGQRPKVCCPLIDYSSSTSVAYYNDEDPSTTEAQSEAEDYVPAFLDPPDCGVRRTGRMSKRSTRGQFGIVGVIGGVYAKLDEFPWMALLGYNTTVGHKWSCGGSLISQRHVLTAGHCIHNYENMLYIVRLGELDYARDNDGANPIDFLIKRMIIHEEYDPNFKTNDIGLLILQSDVTFTNSIRPICIPKSNLRNETFENYKPQVAGWGLTSFRGKPASHLQVLEVPVRSNEECVTAYSPYKGRVVDHRVLCVGSLRRGQQTCNGDSGSPLMPALEWNGTQVYIVIGLTSYAMQCAQPGFPSVHTRVTHFLPWIQERVLGHNTD